MSDGDAGAAPEVEVEVEVVVGAAPDTATIARLLDLGHPNLIRLLDIAVEPSAGIKVLSARPTGTVAGFLRAGPVPVDVAVEVGVRIAGALDVVHRDGGWAHGEVTPHTIAITLDGEPALTGLAAAVLRPAASRPLGPYTPPERTDGGPPTPLGDIYSLAATLYHLLAGEPPFGFPDPDRLDEFAARIQREPAGPTGRFDLAPLAEAAIHRALAKDPGARFPTAADFAAALREAHSVVSVEEAPLENAEASEPQRRPRHSAVPAFLALGVVALILVTVVVLAIVAP